MIHKICKISRINILIDNSGHRYRVIELQVEAGMLGNGETEDSPGGRRDLISAVIEYSELVYVGVVDRDCGF